MTLAQNILGNKTPEQLNSIFNAAKQMGVSEADIQQVKDGINQKVDINIKKGE